MRTEYANYMLDKYHQRFGTEQPNQAQGEHPELHKIMDIWNDISIPYIKSNRYIHVGDDWKLPSQHGTALGWHAYDSELLIRQQDEPDLTWFDVYRQHITKRWWNEGVQQLMELSGYNDPTMVGSVLLAIFKYQVSPNIRPSDIRLTEHLEQLIGNDVVLMEGSAIQDIKGCDYICDPDWSERQDVVVQAKSSAHNWAERAEVEGTRQRNQWLEYKALMKQGYDVYLYDLEHDKMYRMKPSGSFAPLIRPQ